MNIVFLIWNYWPCIEGGSERQARQISMELVKRGHTCTVWTAWINANLPKKEIKDGCTILRFGRWVPWQGRLRQVLERFHHFFCRILSKYFSITERQYSYFQKHFDFWILLPVVYVTRRSFMKEVRGELDRTVSPPNIIHLHEPSWLGGFAVLLAAGKNVPVLCQEATNPVLPVVGYDVPFRKRIERVRKDAHFIAMAPYLAADLYAKGVLKERVHLLPNGVKMPLRRPLQRNSSLVLYVGNFSQGTHWKAFDVLFDAWKIIHDRNLGLRLVVLGGGNRTAWEKYVDGLGCAGSIDFMGRVNNLEEYYAEASVFVLPSRVEGMSNALLEAQSWGIPCVVSDIPANTSVVDNGINGFVVPVNDYEKLALAIIKLHQEPTLRKVMGSFAYKRMKDKYSLGGVTDRLVDIYNKVCEY
ncbi:MAG: glycosyltransferase family 1 protein [Candidatus Electrothrix sp. AW1]|nr:glycosyltransferase family 1 protein [Candidatus Electrothrix sp. AX1]MCI5181168.1 glycosyltransferase family 1 protein [Candidatus Electrothrix gigas]